VFGFSLDLLLPAHLITFVWLLVATYATKVLDGLDGLVTGQTVIGAALVGALTLTTTYFQPGVSVLAAVVGGAFLGFLPHNISPAKQFLGEAGATMAGFSLGVLALLSSAKIAIALSVLAIPIADVVFVVLGRLYRGEPWYRGDMTHLHFRLLRAGLSQQAAVWTLWLVSLFAGIAALGLQTRGKIFLVTSLVVATALASRVTSWFAHKAKDVD
jgi:UDP-GlcNAc:undecaprenyl-phosphate GlcNAc-1-phosphate transferase